MRRLGLTTIFGNPGSTEIPFLTDLPDDIRFVLGLHEGSVVGIATGYALARGEPAFVNLHTAPGLGNAINAIANARDSARRWSSWSASRTAARSRTSRSSPAASSSGWPASTRSGATFRSAPRTSRARSRAPTTRRSLAPARRSWWCRWATGPSLPTSRLGRLAGPDAALVLGCARRQVDELAAMIAEARSPALVVGADSDSASGWAAVTALAERLRCPVWQESFVRRAGFPQDHPLFAGHPALAAGIDAPDARRRTTLVVAIGAGAFRLYLLDEPTARSSSRARALRSITEQPGRGATAALASWRWSARSPIGLQRAGRRGARSATATRRSRCAARRALGPPEPGAPLTSRPRVRRAGAADARRRDRHRGDAVEPARALPAAPDPGAAGLRSRRQRRPRVRALAGAIGLRMGCPEPPGDRHRSATGRRSTRSSRCGAPPSTTSACC